jgi:hypothetical protein
MAKIGRPLLGKHKRHPLAVVTASQAEAKALRKLARAAKLPLAAYLRQKGLETP